MALFYFPCLLFEDHTVYAYNEQKLDGVPIRFRWVVHFAVLFRWQNMSQKITNHTY